MKQLLIIIFAISFHVNIEAQNKYDYTWHMGYRFFRRSSSSLWFGLQLNFDNGKTKIDTMKFNYDFQETVQSTCDSSGNFLFSSNGCKIFNKNFEIMDNGDDLNQVPQTSSSNACIVTIGTSEIIRNGALSLPIPNSKDSLFAFFRTEMNDGVTRLEPIPINVYYSLINMKSNNGLGKVVLKNQVIVRDTMDGGDINAVKHGNSKDWWVISRKFKSDTFYTFRISSNGLDSSFKQAIGTPTTIGGQGGGDACFAPNGLKYAYFTARRDQLMLYDFNRNTGKLANFRRITIPYELDPASVFYSGTAFSGNSKYLYVFTTTQIFQVDTDAADIQASVVEVARYDPVAAPYAYPTGGRLAPDCKIYFVSTNGLNYFGYIRYPDRKGVACQVLQGAIKTPYTSAIRGGLPNNPNYRLGVIPTHPCDSTIDFRVSTGEALLPKVNFVLFPNPATNELNIDFDPINGETQAEITLYNLLGSKVGQQKLDLINTPLSINVANLPSGMYTAVLQIRGRSPAAQKFVIVK